MYSVCLCAYVCVYSVYVYFVSMCFSVYLFVSLCACVSVCFFVCMCACVCYVCLCVLVCVYVYVSICFSVHVSVFLSVCLCVSMSMCLCICIPLCASLVCKAWGLLLAQGVRPSGSPGSWAGSALDHHNRVYFFSLFLAFILLRLTQRLPENLFRQAAVSCPPPPVSLSQRSLLTS